VIGRAGDCIEACTIIIILHRSVIRPQDQPWLTRFRPMRTDISFVLPPGIPGVRRPRALHQAGVHQRIQIVPLIIRRTINDVGWANLGDPLREVRADMAEAVNFWF